MLNMKKFIAVSMVVIMGMCQAPVFAQVADFDGKTYKGMTVEEFANHYEIKEIVDMVNGPVKEIQINIPMESQIVKSELSKNAISFKDIGEDEAELEAFYYAVAKKICEKEGMDGKMTSTMSCLFYDSNNFPKMYRPVYNGAKTCDGYISLSKNEASAGGFSFKVIVTEKEVTKPAATPKPVTTTPQGQTTKKPYVEEKLKAVPPSQVTDRTKYTFPDFPRFVGEEYEYRRFYSNAKADMVYSLYESGKVAGDTRGYMNPLMPVTRAEFATMLVNVLGLEGSSNKTNFADTKGHWAEGAIAIVTEKGLLKGVSEGKFDPNGRITHEQMAVIADRVMQSNGINVTLAEDEKKLPGVAQGDTGRLTYGKEAFFKCFKKGILNETDYFLPTMPSKREDALVILYQLAEVLK